MLCKNGNAQDAKSFSEADIIKLEKQYQSDADIARLEHLLYWTELVEEYQHKKGYFPFQSIVKSKNEIGLVKIATKQQRQYLSPGTDKYNPKLDNNYDNAFREFTVKDFVTELEQVLNRNIEEKYDIQKVPTRSPVGYFYFVENDGYLIWTTCITCGVTKISTLLMDGFTPTVNIVSKGMTGKVTKSLTRKQMLSHQIFKKWINRQYNKKDFVEKIVADNINDSKQQ